MRSEAIAIVDAPSVLREMRSAPPLTIRQVHTDQDGHCGLCLVGSAAGPLAGDELTLRLEVNAGASASLIATGATIAQGRGQAPARLIIEVAVGEGGCLDADPGALIVCAGAQVEVSVSIVLAASATVRWREEIRLGRTDEPAGAAVLDWHVRRDGRALLRQRLDLRDRQLARWPGMLGGHRGVEAQLRVGPRVEAATVVHSATEVTQQLAANATLTTKLIR